MTDTTQLIGGYTQDEVNNILSEYEKVLIEEDRKRWENAPICHMKRMSMDESDEERWWECTICGHTKEF